MAKQFNGLEDDHRAFIEASHIFFVASAAPTGRVNMSPKGMDSLRVLGPNRIAWLNYTIHGYRMPWEQIVVSDGDSGSGMRQAIFAAAGVIACARLIMTRTLGLVLAHYLPWALFALALLSSAVWSEMPSTTISALAACSR